MSLYANRGLGAQRDKGREHHPRVIGSTQKEIVSGDSTPILFTSVVLPARVEGEIGVLGAGYLPGENDQPHD